VNITIHGELRAWLQLRGALVARRFGRTRSASFGRDGDTTLVHRIYVINLDRSPGRWTRMRSELARLKTATGAPLTSITRRFSAIDGLHLTKDTIHADIDTRYTLAEQLFVQPDPALADRTGLDDRFIIMTRQEVAVARSHVEVWRRIANDDARHALVLEDDAYFTRGFARRFDAAWEHLIAKRNAVQDADLLYLSYKRARPAPPPRARSPLMFNPAPGLWQLSGYVLSRDGARRLLDLLPVRGPVDMWINHQFEHLRVSATERPIIRQRSDAPSTNSYSVLPVLSQMGSITRERPLLPDASRRQHLIFVGGPQGMGGTALAMALSMLGYRCISDVTSLPEDEHDRLIRGTGSPVFDAYVNVGSLAPDRWADLALRYRHARFIVTTGSGPQRSAASVDCMDPYRVLILPHDHRDKWQLLTDFLGCDYPTHPYPATADQAERALSPVDWDAAASRPVRWLAADRSPWVVDRTGWPGVPIEVATRPRPAAPTVTFAAGHDRSDRGAWWLRDDTFPSNLALFCPQNVRIDDAGADLVLQAQRSGARDFTSGAIASRDQFTYGTFAAEIRPPAVRGLVTGMFLHRNAPRQEIDIEFVGRDPTTMLANVYYNPGPPGTRLEYGYRGCPAVIDLGFDASADVHLYEVHWWPDVIRWLVDGHVVHQRVPWQPTPIPTLPMQFNVNLWHTRSRELAGRLTPARLPAHARVQQLRLAPVTRHDPAASRGGLD
jgi:GR25 family glycosyltransferase involved in LPS biosynthesis